MDAVLFHPFERNIALFNPFQRKTLVYAWRFVTKSSIQHDISRFDIFQWLSIVHEVKSIKGRLQALKAKSLIEDIGDGFNGVIVHDLYLEFAKSEVKEGALDARRWVWYDDEAPSPTDLAKKPSGNCWSNVERISVKYYESHESFERMGTFKGVKWQQFSNVVVLQLLIDTNDVLDLRGLQCLKSMVLKWRYECGGQVIGLGELSNLAWLEIYNIHYAPCFQEIGQLTRLEVLWLDTNCYGVRPDCEPLEPPNLDRCIHLQELVLRCTCFKSFPDLSKLTSLRKVLFSGCKAAKEVVGLSSQMTSLQVLLLRNCESLRQCPGLSDLVSLQELDVEGCAQFGQTADCGEVGQTLDLHKLTKLRRLTISGTKLNKLLGLDGMMHLQELVVHGVDELPNLHLLRQLERVCVESFQSPMMPRFDNFIALEELILWDLPEVRDIDGMRSLRRLKRLTIELAPNLLQLSDLGQLTALQYLELSDCSSLVGKLDLSDLHHLINLEELVVEDTPIRRLPPSLQRLTKLKRFCCRRTLLSELPVLSGLDKLESIDLFQCRELTSLDKVGTLPGLRHLDVVNCSRLPRLPDLRSSKSLERLHYCLSGVSLGPEDMRALATLPALQMCGWDEVRVDFSELLEEMALTEVILHLETKQLNYFTLWTEDTDEDTD